MSVRQRVILPALALSMALCARAQFEFQLEQSDAPKTLGQVYDAGTANVGEAKDLWLRAVNTSNQPVSVTVLSIAGLGFSILNRPQLPVNLPPAEFIRFRVRFDPPSAGSFSATVRVNLASMILRASAGVVAVLFVEQQGVSSAAYPGQAIDFGNAEKDASTRRKLRIASVAGTTVNVFALALSGGAFRLINPPPLPLILQPLESADFEIEFRPAASGLQQGTLSIDGRAYTLRGMGVDPPLPAGVLVLSEEAPASAMQMSLSVKLAEPSRAAGQGKVRILFTPNPGLSDDPAVMFLASSNREVPFLVREGDQEARFGGATATVFQTGTTSGTIRLVLDIAGNLRVTDLFIPPAITHLGAAAARRSSSSIEFTLGGFDNTRTVSMLEFSFYDQNGNVLGTPVRVNAAESFRRHFAGSPAGGLFGLRAVFPVTGDSSVVRAVETEIVNSSGAARTGRIRIE